MKYDVAFTPEADEDLARITQNDPLLASFILDQAERLAESPSTLITASGIPFGQHQRYSFWGEGEHERTHFHLFFQYGQDEKTIWITGIGVVRY